MSATAASNPAVFDPLVHIATTLRRLAILPAPALGATPVDHGVDPLGATCTEITAALIGDATVSTDALRQAARRGARAGNHYMDILCQGCAALAGGSPAVALEAAIALDRVTLQNPLLTVIAAEAHAALGQFEAAHACWRQAIGLFPNNTFVTARARSALEHISQSDNDPQLAAAAIEHLHDTSSNSSRISGLVASLLQHRYGLAGLPAKSAVPVELAHLSCDALLLAALPRILLGRPDIERFLKSARRQLLQAVADNAAAADHDTLLAAMAQQMWLNEHVWSITDDEAAHLTRLATTIDNALQSGTDAGGLGRRMLAFALFEPIHEQPFHARVAALADTCDWPPALHTAIRVLIGQPLAERATAERITSLTTVTDHVSTAVRAQYEDNPYPRWQEVSKRPAQTSYEHFYGLNQPPFRSFKRNRNAPNVLIAGCGTGRQPIALALAFPDINVTAIDLSRASLAYAQLKAEELGADNITFAHADILKLEPTGPAFQYIESVGVLHHMGDPGAGLARLRRLLARRGIMKLALYSFHARRTLDPTINTAYTHDRAGVRAFRDNALAGRHGNLDLWLHSQDFWSTSMCRDLVFHEQEHRLTLPEIEALLRNNGLKFRVFEFASITIRDQVVRAFRRQFPAKSDITSLAAWDRFEQRNPDTFAGMYQFWVQAD